MIDFIDLQLSSNDFTDTRFYIKRLFDGRLVDNAVVMPENHKIATFCKNVNIIYYFDAQDLFRTIKVKRSRTSPLSKKCDFTLMVDGYKK